MTEDVEMKDAVKATEKAENGEEPKAEVSKEEAERLVLEGITEPRSLFRPFCLL